MRTGARRSRTAVSGVVVALGLLLGGVIAGSPAGAADPFYTGLLQDGARAYSRGDFEIAERNLRIACFGLLDEPGVLVECLMRLGLAQARSGNQLGFQQTYDRLLEVDDRFGIYHWVPLPEGVRVAFETELASLLPDNDLLKQVEPPLPAETEASGSTATSDTGPPVRSPEDRERFNRVRWLADNASSAGNLEIAAQMADDLSTRFPDWREAHLLAAEVAYLSSQWEAAVEYYRRGGEPSAGEITHLFYYAVALFESGEPEAARIALEKALPGMQRTPFVDSYVQRIVGSS